jgi:hypothetical protein
MSLSLTIEACHDVMPFVGEPRSDQSFHQMTLKINREEFIELHQLCRP